MEDQLLVAKTLLKCYPHLEDLCVVLNKCAEECVESGFYAIFPNEQMRLYERIAAYEKRKAGVYNMKYLIEESFRRGNGQALSLLKERFICHRDMNELIEKYRVSAEKHDHRADEGRRHGQETQGRQRRRDQPFPLLRHKKERHRPAPQEIKPDEKGRPAAEEGHRGEGEQKDPGEDVFPERPFFPGELPVEAARHDEMIKTEQPFRDQQQVRPGEGRPIRPDAERAGEVGETDGESVRDQEDRRKTPRAEPEEKRRKHRPLCGRLPKEQFLQQIFHEDLLLMTFEIRSKSRNLLKYTTSRAVLQGQNSKKKKIEF